MFEMIFRDDYGINIPLEKKAFFLKLKKCCAHAQSIFFFIDKTFVLLGSIFCEVKKSGLYLYLNVPMPFLKNMQDYFLFGSVIIIYVSVIYKH